MKASWSYPQFWVGMMWGAILIAAMDYGDAWICIGACDNLIARAIEEGG